MTGFAGIQFTIPQHPGKKYTIRWLTPAHCTTGPSVMEEFTFEHTATAHDGYGSKLLTFKCLQPNLAQRKNDPGWEIDILFSPSLGHPGKWEPSSVFADYFPFGREFGLPGEVEAMEYVEDAGTESVGSPHGSPPGSPRGSEFGSVQYWKRKAATKKNWNSKVVDRFYRLYSNAR